MKKFILFLVISVTIFFFTVEHFGQFKPRKDRKQSLPQLLKQGAVGISIPGPRPKQALVEALHSNPRNLTAMDVAEAYLKHNRQQWEIQDYHELRPVVFQTPTGTHVKYSIYQDKLPIVGMEIRLVIGKNLSVLSVDNNYSPVPRSDIHAEEQLLPDDILDLASERYTLQKKMTPTPSKILYLRPGMEEPELAYILRVQDKYRDDRPAQLIMRASDGQILSRTYSRKEF